MGDFFEGLIDLALIGTGLYNIWSQPVGTPFYLIGFIFVMWGSLGSRIGRLKP